MRKRFFTICLGLLLCVTALAVFSCLRVTGWLLPGWVSWERTTLFCGPEGPDEIQLHSRTVKVRDAEEIIWRSDRSLRVQSILWGDVDHDDAPELMLLCWKRGRYGESRPFWVTEDKQIWSQHIYLYDWAGGELRPIWMASDLGIEVAAWSFDEVRRMTITDRSGSKSHWDWNSWGLSPMELPTLTFAAVGDNLIHRQIYDYAFRNFGGSFDGLYAEVQAELDRYDVTSIHQETVFVDDPGAYSDYPRFGTPLPVGEAIINAGFDIVSCASNHALDQGVEAITRTADLFRRADVICAGIQPSTDGAYRPYERLERNGISCAIFAYTQSTNGIPLPEDAPWMVHTLDDEARIRSELLKGRAEADLCLVYVHWGTEYADQPDETQRRWAQVFADCGVDVVIGTHPHVLQPVEWVTGAQGNRTLVYFSLGNFISAQQEASCRRGGLAWFRAEKLGSSCEITEFGLKQLITKEENGYYSTQLES